MPPLSLPKLIWQEKGGSLAPGIEKISINRLLTFQSGCCTCCLLEEKAVGTVFLTARVTPRNSSGHIKSGKESDSIKQVPEDGMTAAFSTLQTALSHSVLPYRASFLPFSNNQWQDIQSLNHFTSNHRTYKIILIDIQTFTIPVQHLQLK